MTDTLEHSPSVLSASPGDVLFSRQRIPYPGLILQGFTRQHRDLPKIEPFVSFQQLQLLLEFLEFVVLTERLIVPIPNFSRRTQKLVSSLGLTQKKLSEYIEFLLDLVRCSFRNHLVNDHETYST